MAGGTIPFANVQSNNGVCKEILIVLAPQLKLVRHYKLVPTLVGTTNWLAAIAVTNQLALVVATNRLALVVATNQH